MWRALPFAMPAGAITWPLIEWSEMRESGTATTIVLVIASAALVLAAIAAARVRGVPRQPGTFVLCCLLGGLAFFRVPVDIIFRGAHAFLDRDAITHDLVKTWLTLAMAVLAGLAAVVLARRTA